MSTFKAYLKKEILESIRQYKYLIIGISILFFAISDPIMMKALPLILKSQNYKGIESMLPTQRGLIMQNYLKDLFQIVNIVIVFCVSGTLGKEIGGLKFIFPYSKGCNPSEMVFAKAVHHIITTVIMVYLGFLANYYYVGVLFKDGKVNFSALLISASLMGLFYAFIISFLTFCSLYALLS